MLQLYEASFFQMENESTLESAREFTAKHLKQGLEEKGLILDQELVVLAQHALELPLHWRMLRVEARWFIDVYDKKLNKKTILLELAKLDFNIVQAIHQNDLKDASRWEFDSISEYGIYLILIKLNIPSRIFLEEINISSPFM